MRRVTGRHGVVGVGFLLGRTTGVTVPTRSRVGPDRSGEDGRPEGPRGFELRSLVVGLRPMFPS